MKISARHLLVTLASVFSLSACVSKDLRAIDDSSPVGIPGVTVIAHQGDSSSAPENTFAAFDKAQDLGALACDTEIQLTKDGQLIVFNDDTLDEKTELKGPVNTHTWADLSRVDLASWFAKIQSNTAVNASADPGKVSSPKKSHSSKRRNPSSRHRSRTNQAPAESTSLTRLISLDDLFERYGMTFTYYVEIKALDEKIPALALQTVKEYGLQDNVTFTSFNVDQLTRMRKLDTTIPLCYLIDDKKTPDIDAEIQRASGLGFNEVSVRASLVRLEHVKRAKALKLKIMSWGVGSDEDMKQAVQAGVSGISTSWPKRLMAILQIPISR